MKKEWKWAAWAAGGVIALQLTILVQAYPGLVPSDGWRWPWWYGADLLPELRAVIDAGFAGAGLRLLLLVLRGKVRL